jgi:hypothetical protein
MTAANLLRLITDAIRPAIEASNGSVQISGTPESTMNLLRNKPSRWRAIVQWNGEAASTQHSSAQSLTFLVLVQRHVGFKHGDHADETVTLELLDIATQAVRGIMTDLPDVDTTELHRPALKYWISDDDFPHQQAAAQFTIGYCPDRCAQLKL